MPAVITAMEAIENLDELKHLRNVTATQAKLLAAATRFVFGHYAAMNFYWGELDFPTRWAVYRMMMDQRLGRCAKRDLTMAEACDLAMQMDGEERT